MAGHGTKGQPALAATRTAAEPVRIMIAGDSITHAHEGDFGWRYRLWQWLARQNVPFDFVGPYTGVDAPLAALPPQPPQPTESPLAFELKPDYPGTGPYRIPWGYAEEVSKDFDADHFSTSGYQARLAKEVIEHRVREHRPDVMLVLLGYNDLSWTCSGTFSSTTYECLDQDLPEQVLERIKTVVDNARKANPSLKFAIANIVHRTKFRDDITRNTIRYNTLIKEQLPSWSTAQSPVYLVDIASSYSCGPDVPCLGAFDGLHPSSLGDYELARPFAKVMIENLAIGLENASPLEVPALATIPRKDLSPPRKEDIRAEGSPMGIKLTWDRRYGILGYETAHRLAGAGDDKWEVYRMYRNRTDVVVPEAGIEYEFKLRACYGVTCENEWSEVVKGVSTRSTGPPPTKIRTISTTDGFSVSWSPPENKANKWNITQYGIGHTYPGWPMWTAFGSYARSGNVTGLLPGEIRSIRLATWTDPEGGSIYRYARPIVVGGGTPSTPRELKLHRTSNTSIKATWDKAEGAAGYLIDSQVPGHPRKPSKAKDIGVIGIPGQEDPIIAYTTEQNIGIPENIRGQHQICVVAVNGELESERVCALIGQPSLEMSVKDYTRSFSYWGAVFPAVLLLGTWLVMKKLRRRKREDVGGEGVALK